MDADQTSEHLIDLLPADAVVAVLGWPDAAGDALLRRGDLSVLAIESGGRSAGFVRRLQRADVEVEEIGPDQLGSAVAFADLLIVEAAAVGADSGLMSSGQVEIRRGIEEGDIVVARAGALLREGDPVRPVTAAAEGK